MNWKTQFIGGGEFDEEFQDDWDTEYEACTGLIEGGQKVECRPIQETGNYLNHTAAINWQVDNYSVTFGVKNVFDTKPELVDSYYGPSNVRNMPIGVGYDLYGRSFYLNFAMAM